MEDKMETDEFNEFSEEENEILVEEDFDWWGADSNPFN